jgi:hypothetical protein
MAMAVSNAEHTERAVVCETTRTVAVWFVLFIETARSDVSASAETSTLLRYVHALVETVFETVIAQLLVFSSALICTSETDVHDAVCPVV